MMQRLATRGCPALARRGSRTFTAAAPGLNLNELTTLKVSISGAMSSKSGSLLSVLEVFGKYRLSLTHMESQLHQYSFGDAVFEFDFEAALDDEATQSCMRDLVSLEEVSKVTHIPPRTVPWFPTSLRELDSARTTLDGGTQLVNEDHPGFHDEAYKTRRAQIVENAKQHRFGLPLPVVDYTEEEHRTWQLVFDRLRDMQTQYACDDFLQAMDKFSRYGVLTPERIPQLSEVSDLLQASTGFQIRPVQGLLTARDFLNSLAFRVFWSTQYIRHHSNPFYTPEPDICHEILGHVPLFAHPDFAEFSQTIGLASLGASDAQIDQLATLYWFTVEFGVLRTPSGVRAYGAGLLSSFGELEWACAPAPSSECRERGGLQAYDKFKDMERPQINELVGDEACKTPFPITTYQPLYFASRSLADAKDEVMKFCDTLKRPFFCSYDPFTQRIKVTRSIQRAPPSSTGDLQASKQADYFEGLKAAAA
uniref:phenylalanine 4-monooxygenase n=1 Tax=Pyrodinium bahamense TaxID=73915 RepID=A0A7S0AM86_9DINO|mmetsp:Transcript_3773/g.10441  ORF Transcript_3773/g.10441 Transcript_3773/m.10441 type:complete len:479 (+) Transcript_3773:54-1490(+)